MRKYTISASRSIKERIPRFLIGSCVVLVLVGIAALVGTKLHENSIAKQRAFVESRISELQDLAYENDSQSLRKILSELRNKNREIRKAALEAAVQFGSRDAIPGLREAEIKTADDQEKKAIHEAIEFLKLPSLSELVLRNKPEHH